MKISDVSRIFDIPQETLRFLEQQGILNPSRNSQNAYRDYTVYDFGPLMSYMKYKKMNFTIREISALFQEKDLTYLQERLGEKMPQLEEDIRYQQLLYDYLLSYRQAIDVFSENIGTFRFEKAPEYAYISAGSATTNTEEYRDSLLATEWRKAVPFVTLAYLIRVDDIRQDNPPVNCVMLTEKKYLELLPLPVTEEVSYTDGAICLQTNAIVESFGESHRIYQEALSFAESRGYHPAGPFLSILLTKCEGKRYMEIKLPVRRDGSSLQGL